MSKDIDSSHVSYDQYYKQITQKVFGLISHRCESLNDYVRTNEIDTGFVLEVAKMVDLFKEMSDELQLEGEPHDQPYSLLEFRTDIKALKGIKAIDEEGA